MHYSLALTKQYYLALPKLILFSLSLMSPVHRARALNLYLAQQCKGSRAALIQKSGLSKGRIAQMLKDGFGELAARSFEKRVRLETRWFEQEHGQRLQSVPQVAEVTSKEKIPTPGELAMDLQRQVAELVRDWLSLNEIDRNRFKRELSEKALMNQDDISDHKPTGQKPRPAVN